MAAAAAPLGWPATTSTTRATRTNAAAAANTAAAADAPFGQINFNLFCFVACVEINYTQPTNTRAFHFLALSSTHARPRSCASGAQRPKDCQLKKKRASCTRARERKGGETESGCGGAAEPAAASQDDALEPKTHGTKIMNAPVTSQRPPAAKKRRG